MQFRWEIFHLSLDVRAYLPSSLVDGGGSLVFELWSTRQHSTLAVNFRLDRLNWLVVLLIPIMTGELRLGNGLAIELLSFLVSSTGEVLASAPWILCPLSPTFRRRTVGFVVGKG